MQKLLALVMAALLLVSTTGVTVACMVCEQTGKPVSTCHTCGHVPNRVSISAKSCCAASTHRIAVTDSFAQPVQPVLLVPMAGVMPAPVSVAPQGTSLASVAEFSSLPPPSSVEYCARISSFRI